MKKLIFILFLITEFIVVYAQDNLMLQNHEYYSYGGDVTWEFISDSLCEISEITNSEGYQSKTVEYTYNNKGPYYTLVLKEDNKETEYLALQGMRNEFILLYNNPKHSPIYNGFFGRYALNYMGKTVYTTDNYLTEGKIKYTPDNLSNIDIGKPWVEGSADSGIGNKIKIDNSYVIQSLVISNGFVSYKVSTYYNNNRVKTLQVYNSNNRSENFIVELPDNAIPFEIKLPFNSKNVELEILDIYKGEKYDDTCINFILCKND